MTQHVRTSYRHHRKATWALVLGVVAAIAAIAIPLASGARPATYTFTGNASVCAGATQTTFSVTLTNTTRSSQNLGSADLYAPSNMRVASASITTGTGSPPALSTVTLNGESRSLVSLRNLSLPGGQTPNAALTLSITANSFVAASPQPRSWYSIAKQSNDFNPGDLDLSNAFSLSGSNPTFEVATCRLEFVTQPPNPWEKDTTAASPVEVAAFAGATRVTLSGTPSLTVASGSAGTTANFSFGSATFDTGTTSWKWPNARPSATAPSGLYNLVATLGSMTDTSDSSATAGDQPFRVTDAICAPGQPCNVTSNLAGPQAQLGLTNILSTPIAIDFLPGGSAEPKCAEFSPWNRAYYDDSSGRRYFPGVEMDFAWGGGVLQIVYRVRNSEWTLTNVSRGNSDIEFCAGAKHNLDTHLNKPKADGGVPFVGKYGDARWYESDGLFWGVLATVSNPSKVKPGGDPAVCARGGQDLPTGLGGSSETWRTWTICIPRDWDWKNFG